MNRTNYMNNKNPIIPELAIITELDDDHPLRLSLSSKLIEKGIFFQIVEIKHFKSFVMNRLKYCKALLIDEKILRCIMSGTAELQKIENFAKQNFIFTMGNLSCKSTGVLGIAAVCDHYTDGLVASIIAHAELTIFHPEAQQIQLQRSNSEILAVFKKQLCKRLIVRHSWNEFLLHDWKAALCLSGIPQHRDIRPLLIDSINSACINFPEGIHHDQLGGFFATAWLYENTDNKLPFKKMLCALDGILRRRPRIDGIISGCGYEDDPLLINHNSHWSLAGTTVRRKVMWNESLHFLGPTVGAATRITGNWKYALEALELTRYIRKYHQDHDGLFFHCSRDKKPIGQKWSRGVAHALYGMIYLLEELSDNRPLKNEILEIIRNVGKGLKKYQDQKTGLWRNVIDEPKSRIESSGSTCFVYVFLKCINEGWLDEAEFYEMAKKAFRGLKNIYWHGGLCCMCRGSGTGDLNYYISRPQGWGIVPQFIMAMCEYEKSVQRLVTSSAVLIQTIK